MLKKIHRVALFSILIILTITFRPSLAADYNQVGVRVGDTAEYDAQLSSLSDVNRLHILVYGIVGTVVTLNLIYYFKNGTQEHTTQMTEDICNGAGDPLYLFLITPNLKAGDSIYSGASEMIDRTDTMNFAGASRSINHYTVGDPSWESYWDQATGLTVRLTYWIFGWTNLTLTSTSLWSGGLPLPVILLIGGIALFVGGMIAGFILGRRGGEKTETKKKKRKK
jgi:hypothetical protein